MPFLAATNPDIDWTKGAFKGTIVAVTHGLRVSREQLFHWVLLTT
jgi:hypothetical protein